jgi:hypothetical protein
MIPARLTQSWIESTLFAACGRTARFADRQSHVFEVCRMEFPKPLPAPRAAMRYHLGLLLEPPPTIEWRFGDPAQFFQLIYENA